MCNNIPDNTLEKEAFDNTVGREKILVSSNVWVFSKKNLPLKKIILYAQPHWLKNTLSLQDEEKFSYYLEYKINVLSFCKEGVQVFQLNYMEKF